MAGKTTSGGIQFGDWKLIPMDANNWELAHRHANQRGDNKGRVQWNRLGRYYQYDTIPSALRYAADFEAKARHKESKATFEEYLREYEEMTERLIAEMREALNDARGN
jgi:hypothetical protein